MKYVQIWLHPKYPSGSAQKTMSKSEKANYVMQLCNL